VATANQEILDASIRHATAVQRFAAGEVKEVLALLEAADRELVVRLRKRLARLPKRVDFTSRRWKALIADIRQARGAIITELKKRSMGTTRELAKVERDAELAILTKAVAPLEFTFASVDVPSLVQAIRKPFQGQTLEKWWGELKGVDARRLTRELQLGYTEGESIPNIVKRVAGTRAQGFRDGVLSITRRNAETVVRTAINHTSNMAREAVWQANADVIQAIRWVSTLDGRTTPICRARDGKVAPVGDRPLPPNSDPLHPPGARPPAHPGCRSRTAPVIGPEVVGERPWVRDTRTGRRRQLDFAKQARRQKRSVKSVREEWYDKNIGQVPAKTTYNEWLGTQPAKFQNEVLGPTRGKLFRKGGLEMDKFVDRAGNELTLAQLADRDPTAFMKAGLDPGDF
jgi:SPP1 gp7 family putative phage head morphogenesis protein